jgi:1-pyrroline-5-carboxylate dehydrogenase
MTVKITYATMSADNEELNQAYEAGVERARQTMGAEHPFFVNGDERWTDAKHEERSPIDSAIVVGRYSQGSAEDVDDAIAAAKAYQPEWDALGWRARIGHILAAADVLEQRQFELSALMSFEVGKNRLEALGDVAETVEFCRYYARQLESHDGFVIPLNSLGPSEKNSSVLRPHGVWAVISPFNFPMALAGGPTIAALLTGNTVVLKPSNAGTLLGLELYRAFRDAGLPPGAFHVVTGPGSVVGDALVHHKDVAGITFTGSYDVGMNIYRTFASGYPKPAVCEMGGKNPTVVSASADLDEAVEGVARAAFGFSGQKCSACSRVYVERPAYDAFVDKLVARTASITVGDPTKSENWMGPVIDDKTVGRFREAVAETNDSGGRVLAGGSVLTENGLERGNFVEPTVVAAPFESWVWSRELFMPFVVVGPVDSVGEGIDRANATEYGLTAGFFSKDDAEIESFFNRIEAGVTYVNRRAGATTGAWPDIQSFGGWKGSGTSGTGGGGPWYLRQYMREQSRTRIV